MWNWLKGIVGVKPRPPKLLRCPRCGGTRFHEGPSGGAATNVLCADPGCRHWFNLVFDRLEDLDRVEPVDILVA